MVLFGASRASATFPGANGRIAFSEYAPYYGIVSVRPNGTDARQLAAGYSPSWSADGQSLVYERSPSGSGLATMREDGTDQTPIPNTSGGTEPSFAPGGKRIAYVDSTVKRPGIYTIATDGSARHLVIRGGPFDTPRFSPDGKQIAFAGSPDGSHQSTVWTVNRDGSGLQMLVKRRQVKASPETPDWNPDGVHIMFTGEAGSSATCDCTLYQVRANGSGLHKLFLGGDERPLPVYAPAGDRVAFHYSNELGCSTIVNASLTGTGIRTVSSDPCGPVGGPTWQPVPR